MVGEVMAPCYPRPRGPPERAERPPRWRRWTRIWL